MDTNINVYILSIFLKLHKVMIILTRNISTQRFVDMEKFTFEIDDQMKIT